MPTQQEIADHLGMNQSEVSRHMATLGLDWKAVSMDQIRLTYLAHLRGVAAGHRSADGIDLARERALTEQVDRELKQLTLAEKKGQLINVAELEPALARQYMAFRVELESRDDKLKEELDELYGIDVELEVIATHTREALAHLAGDAASGGLPDGATEASGSSNAEADDD
jgi:hypothetical protein